MWCIGITLEGCVKLTVTNALYARVHQSQHRGFRGPCEKYLTMTARCSPHLCQETVLGSRWKQGFEMPLSGCREHLSRCVSCKCKARMFVRVAFLACVVTFLTCTQLLAGQSFPKMFRVTLNTHMYKFKRPTPVRLQHDITRQFPQNISSSFVVILSAGRRTLRIFVA